MKYKFGICGPFDFKEQGTGGQSVKTREFYYALSDAVGKEKIKILESTEYKKNPVKFLFNYILLLRSCDNTVILPAQNGIRFLAPLSVWFKGKGKVHYSVIGGWLPQLLVKKTLLKKFLISFDTIFVETNVMKQELESQGFLNVKRLLNFKRLKPVEEEKGNHTPIRLCFFSRIAKEKGIEDAISVVKKINSAGVKCVLDIYGPVISEYEKEFTLLRCGFPETIKYCGKVAPEKSIEILRDYDIQLFPTKYPTEGIPGSIVDSYFAGVPVLAAKWNSFNDVVKEEITGVGFQQGDIDEFYNKLEWLINHPLLIKDMKKNCIKEAKNYMPDKVLQDFFQMI